MIGLFILGDLEEEKVKVSNCIIKSETTLTLVQQVSYPSQPFVHVS